MFRRTSFSVLIALLFSIAPIVEVLGEEIVVYSTRGNTLTRKPFAAFTRTTGIRINVVNGEINELLERLQNEGEDSPADVLLTVDAGSLWDATQAGLFQPITSNVLMKNIPDHLREPDNHWFGLSKRARTIVYSTLRVRPSELSTYEDLAHPRWNRRLCLRTAKKVYNQSLVAMMIAQHGVDETEKIIRGWVQNLAEMPYEKDNDVIHAINEGKCDVGIVNHYYFGRLLKADPGKQVALFWPNQGENDSGVYVDISGAGILKNARNKRDAVIFLEWLSSEKAQNLFADSNMEYPVNPRVKPTTQIQEWGDFKQNTENILHSGEYRNAAVELMKRANYR